MLVESERPPAPTRHQSGMIATGAADELFAEPATVQAYRSARGEVRLWLAAPNVVVVKYVGYTDGGCVDFLAAAFATLVPSRRDVHLFVDCEEQTGYEMTFPSRIADWAREVLPRLRTVCIFVCSRIVAFGVAVVNVVTGGHASTVTTREEFVARLAASVREPPGGNAA